jgi:hypothetical protein
MLMGSLGKVTSQQDRSSERYALLKQIFEIAGQVFPQIELRVQENNPSFHAQAYVWCGQQTVTLLGGLAFHIRLQKDGLLFTTLHEIGHHVAPGPRMTCTNPLSCDCAADRWTTDEGLRLFSAHGMPLDIRLALDEIEAALSDLLPAFDLKSDRWCFDWPRRKKTLTSGSAAQVSECEFRKLHR